MWKSLYSYNTASLSAGRTGSCSYRTLLVHTALISRPNASCSPVGIGNFLTCLSEGGGVCIMVPHSTRLCFETEHSCYGMAGAGGVVMNGPIERTRQDDDTVFQQWSERKCRWCGRKFTLLPLRTHFSRERPGGKMAYLGRDLTKAKAKEHVTFHM